MSLPSITPYNPRPALAEVDLFASDSANHGADLLRENLVCSAESHFDGVVLIDVAEQALASAHDQIWPRRQVIGELSEVRLELEVIRRVGITGPPEEVADHIRLADQARVNQAGH